MERLYRAAELRKIGRLRERRRKRMLIGAALCAAVLVLSVLGVSRLAASPDFLISEISVAGAVVIPADVIKAAAEKQLTGAYWGLVPRANRFVVPYQEVSAAVRAVSPRIKTADATVSEHSLFIAVAERAAYALLCRGLPPEGSSCYLADEDGFIFDTAPEIRGGTFLRWFSATADDASSVPVGGYIFGDAAAFHDAEFVLNEIRSFELSPVAVSVSDERDVFVYLAAGGHVKIGRTDNYAQALSGLKALLSDPGLNLKDAASDGTLDYIDVRFGNKAFYKLHE